MLTNTKSGCLRGESFQRVRPIMKIMRSTKDSFDPQEFLSTEGPERKLREFRRGEPIFHQGDFAGSVIYVQKGGVKLSVVNGAGKEAVVAIFGPGDFVGVGCMGSQLLRMGTATAMTPVTVLAIDKSEMLRALHDEQRLSDHFIEYMLGRNIRMEADLIDQLFNSCEKRLARALLLLAGYGEQRRMDPLLKVSQQTLAEMIGTTRSRVNFFMNKFRKLGFIEYKGKITIKKTLLAVALHEQGSGVFAEKKSCAWKNPENFKAQPANTIPLRWKKRKTELFAADEGPVPTRHTAAHRRPVRNQPALF